MKHLMAILFAMAALPAAAHEVGYFAHLHPHEPVLAAIAVVCLVLLVALPLWKSRRNR